MNIWPSKIKQRHVYLIRTYLSSNKNKDKASQIEEYSISMSDKDDTKLDRGIQNFNIRISDKDDRISDKDDRKLDGGIQDFNVRM